MCAILHLTEVILHEFEEDECEILFDTQVMECNTLHEGRVLIIDIVTLKKKNEICEQNYAAHATYSTKVERMKLEKMLILPKNWTILYLMVRGSQPIVVVLERVKHNTLFFFLMLVINESIEQVGRKKSRCDPLEEQNGR